MTALTPFDRDIVLAGERYSRLPVVVFNCLLMSRTALGGHQTRAVAPM